MLRARNFSKRNIVSENTPPSHTSLKSQRILQDAARRRRARNTAKRSVKYDVEQAKRKNQRNPVRLNVVVVAHSADVDMQDAQVVPPKVVPVLLPRVLGQPPISESTEEAIKAASSPYFSGQTAGFVRDNLVERGPRMLRTAISVRAEVDNHALPKELAVMVHDLTAVDLPTHMLAVYAPVPKDASSSHKTQVKMYPIHSLVMAAHCAKLPPFALSPATVDVASAPSTGPRQLTLPVRPLCLPHPPSFPYLTQYFYLRRAEVFHSGFFPASPPDAYVEDPQNPQNILSFAAHLGKTFNPTALLERASTIHGVWMNACALGAFDNDLWAAIDSAWEVILNALAIGTGNPRAVVIPSPEPQPSSQEQH